MIVAVASGKGGTGKTTVATSLAISLANGKKVQFLDCDVEEPNAHLFLHPTFVEENPVYIPVPGIDRTRCNYCGRCVEICAYNAIAVLEEEILTFLELCHGCGGCSYFCPQGAIKERNKTIGLVEAGHASTLDFVQARLNIGDALATPLIKAVKQRLDPKRTVIIDVAPGTSCPVIEAVRNTDFCILVTEPTPFGLHDLTMAMEMLQKLQVPCGVIVNRSAAEEDKCERQIESLCLSQKIPLLLKIPLSRKIAGLYARGTTLVEGLPEWQSAFKELFAKIEELVLK